LNDFVVMRTKPQAICEPVVMALQAGG
jgi:hypothetical protein